MMNKSQRRNTAESRMRDDITTVSLDINRDDAMHTTRNTAKATDDHSCS